MPNREPTTPPPGPLGDFEGIVAGIEVGPDTQVLDTPTPLDFLLDTIASSTDGPYIDVVAPVPGSGLESVHTILVNLGAKLGVPSSEGASFEAPLSVDDALRGGFEISPGMAVLNRMSYLARFYSAPDQKAKARVRPRNSVMPIASQLVDIVRAFPHPRDALQSYWDDTMKDIQYRIGNGLRGLSESEIGSRMGFAEDIVRTVYGRRYEVFKEQNQPG